MPCQLPFAVLSQNLKANSRPHPQMYGIPFLFSSGSGVLFRQMDQNRLQTMSGTPHNFRAVACARLKSAKKAWMLVVLQVKWNTAASAGWGLTGQVDASNSILRQYMHPSNQHRKRSTCQAQPAHHHPADSTRMTNENVHSKGPACYSAMGEQSCASSGC